MFERIERSDGSVIILAPQQDTKAITIQVLYKVGSRNETAKINGASHFVEHIMFKGTKKRPTTQVISRELDSIGAEYNAYTGKDRTGYYIKADASHLELATDVLADMLRHAKFDAVEIDKERTVIIEEINMYEDNPMMHIEDMYEELVYKGTVMGRNIAGPRKVIREVTRDELFDYKNKYYYGGNMVIGLTGNFDITKALKLLNKKFPVAKKKKDKVKINKLKLDQKKQRVQVQYKEAEQVQMQLGFPGLPLKHKDLPALMVLANILGGNMSSRLFINVRERKGLCYFIRASADSHEDIGTFSVRAGLDKSRIEPALELIKQELNRVKKTKVTSEELKRAKENIRGTTILKMENPSNFLGYLQTQELLEDRLETLEQKLEKIADVKKDDIQRVAKRIIQWKKSNLAMIGPFKSTRVFHDILKK